jgi:hypothetical protein
MANEPWSEDLLDYLAGYLVDHGYDLKALLGHVAGSLAYQARPAVVEGGPRAGAYAFLGPELKRMTAEQFLDAVWLVTGAGPPKADAPVTPSAEAVSPSHRFVRASLVNADPLSRSLGRPNREQVVTTRGDVLTTLQALDLSNGQALTDTAARGASNLLKGHPGAAADALARAVYLRALGRDPTADERATARDLVGDPASAEGLADLLWAVFMLPGFQLVR